MSERKEYKNGKKFVRKVKKEIEGAKEKKEEEGDREIQKSIGELEKKFKEWENNSK